MQEHEPITALEKLTPKQRESLRWVYRRLQSKQIALVMGVSPHTVDEHVRSALRILGVPTRVEAAHLLAEHELADGPPQPLRGPGVAPNGQMILPRGETMTVSDDDQIAFPAMTWSELETLIASQAVTPLLKSVVGHLMEGLRRQAPLLTPAERLREIAIITLAATDQLGVEGSIPVAH